MQSPTNQLSFGQSTSYSLTSLLSLVIDHDQFSLAPRVSSNINIPVRRQIAFAKQIKKMVAEEAKPAPPPKKVGVTP